MLVERQRDIQMVDPFALRDLADLAERAEQRQAAVADVVTPRAVVHESDDLVTQFPVLQDAVRHEAAKVS